MVPESFYTYCKGGVYADALWVQHGDPGSYVLPLSGRGNQARCPSPSLCHLTFAEELVVGDWVMTLDSLVLRSLIGGKCKIGAGLWEPGNHV